MTGREGVGGAVCRVHILFYSAILFLSSGFTLVRDARILENVNWVMINIILGLSLDTGYRGSEGYQDTREPENQDTREPENQDTRKPGNQDTREPGYQGTRIPGYQDTRIPGKQGTRIPGY